LRGIVAPGWERWQSVSAARVAIALLAVAAGWRLGRKSSDIWFITCQRATSRESCGSETLAAAWGAACAEAQVRPVSTSIPNAACESEKKQVKYLLKYR